MAVFYAMQASREPLTPTKSAPYETQARSLKMTDVCDVWTHPGPQRDGMKLKDGVIYFCYAETRRVCTVPLP